VNLRFRGLPGLVIPAAILLTIPDSSAAQAGSPAGPVPVPQLEARRRALLDRLGNGIAVLRSGKVRSIEGDYPQDSDYRENNDFFYLTGLEEPDAWLVLTGRKTGQDQATLYLRSRDTTTEKWTGPRLGPGPEAVGLSGIRDVRPAERAEDEIKSLVRKNASPARTGALYLSEREEQEWQFLSDVVRKLQGTQGRMRVDDLDPVIASLRLVKDSVEIARLRRAIAITADALKESMRAARPGIWEYELEALIEYTFRRNGAERVGFPSIIASGPNAVTLHYDKNRRQVRQGELVVEDVGAEFGYYSADVTRTIPADGHFAPRQRALYDLVLGSQQAAIDAVRPGTNLAALNRIARAYMQDHSADLCGPGSCVPYFIHGLSHWLGMDVHDVGSFGKPLQAGMVLTVEPGIYLPAEGLGLRIEDDVLVTPQGHEVLSQAVPRSADEIEGVMAHSVP
jgi:Xaa-Pro aminopeptidase